MANYVVPQLRVFQEFAASDVTNTTSMQACIVAPKYIVLDGESNDSYVGDFEKGVAFSLDYPTVAGGTVTDVKVFLRNAYIDRYNTTFGTAATGEPTFSGNAATFETAVTGADVASGEHAFKVGDRLVLRGASGEAEEVYTITGFNTAGTVVYVNTTILAAATSGTIHLLSLEDAEVTGEDGVVPGTNALVLPVDLLSDGDSVESGMVYVSLTAFDASLSGIISTVSRLADIETLLGAATPANPLAMMVKVAMQNSNGRPVSFISVATDDTAGYEAAFELLDGDSVAYSIVPYSQDAAVRTALVTKITELAGATVMNWKIGWCGYDPATEATVLSEDTSGAALSTIVAVPATALVINDADLRLVTTGDTITLTKNGVDTVSTVASVSSLTNTVTVEDSIEAGAYTVVFTRTATALSKAAEAAAVAKALDNPRIRLVVGDAPVLTGFVGTPVPAAYLAAAAAGLRSASAPHQPITRVSLAGVSLLNSNGYTASNMDTMAGDGVWVVARDTGSSLVYNRHQLTTCTSEPRQREDSKITNADEISRYYRESLDDLYGRANISDELIETLYLRLDTVYQNITGRRWSWEIGKQITDITSTTVARDPDFSDRLIVRVALTTPDPLNNLDVYLTIS